MLYRVKSKHNVQKFKNFVVSKSVKINSRQNEVVVHAENLRSLLVQKKSCFYVHLCILFSVQLYNAIFILTTGGRKWQTKLNHCVGWGKR